MNKSSRKKAVAAAILSMVYLYGVTLGNVVFAEAAPQTPVAVESAANQVTPVAGTRLPGQEAETNQQKVYTGVIVDASGLGLETTFSPLILDTNGRAIYGKHNIDPRIAISQGMVEYATGLTGAVAKSRAGSNPLVVKALRVQSGRNSANKVNLVVSTEDGDKILLANESSGMLKNCAVVFVK